MRKVKKLTAKKLEGYKNKLLALKDYICQQIKEIGEDTLMKSQKDISGDISGYGIHMADVASDNYEREFSLGLVSGERELLLEIEHALKRIDDKTYGTCLMCSKSIAQNRLEAVLYTKYCLACQEKIDKERRK